MWTFIVGSLFIPYIFLLLLGGMNTLARVQRVFFVIANFGMIALFAVMFTTPTSTFMTNFNGYMQSVGSPTTYESVVNTAKSVGYSPGWTLIPTLMALPYAFGMYGGYNWSSYIAGEVKDSRRKMAWTILPTALLSILLFVLMGLGIFHLAGFDFYNGIQYIYYLKPDAYPQGLILPPLINYFATFATHNFWIIFAILVAYVFNGIWMIGGMPTFISRCWFAWAFDRVIPAKIADVSERFGVPTYVAILEGIFTWIALYLLVFTQFFAFTANVYVGWMVCYAIVALSVTIFPWKNRELFESSVPARYKRRVAGVPLLSILGGMMFAFFVFMTYAASVNQALGGPMTWASVGIGIFGIFILGIAIYAISYYYHKGIGIDIGLAFKQIPPE
jgi:amino acid transporter